MTTIKAICFDLDGVLADMCEAHYQALNKALGIFGYKIEKGDHLKVYNGLPTLQKLKMMTEKGELPASLHDIISDCKKSYTKDEVRKNCKPEHQKTILMTHLKKKYKLACCSNAIKESVVEMLTGLGLLEYFDEVIGNDEGMAPKPAPDIYLEAFKRLGVTPEEALIIEDAPHGIEAAKASGAAWIAVKDSSEVNLTLFEKNGFI